jgi:hypothetical protein
MSSVIVIPIIIVAIVGIAGYLAYRFVIYDAMCNNSVNKTLQRYNIKKSQSQIIREYNQIMGESMPEKRITELKKYYRQHEPDQFLAMYDKIRESVKDKKDDKGTNNN